MAIVWGAYTGSPWRFRIGFSVVSKSTPSPTSGAVNATVNAYFYTPNTIGYSGVNLNWSCSGGGGSGVLTANLNGTGTIYVGQFSISMPINTSAARITATLSGSLGGIGGFSSGTAYLTTSTSWAWPAPYACTGQTVARIADNRIRLNWSNNPSPAGPVRNIAVVRSTDGGADVVVARLPATTSYDDTTTSAGHLYSYYLRAYNADAYAAASYTGSVTTTPTPPGPVDLRASGADLVATWANPNNRGVEVIRRVNGAEYGSVVSLSAGATTYTIVAASAGDTHILEVRFLRTSDTNTVASAWTWSNPVNPGGPPLAPTGLTPAVQEIGAETPILWTHQPVDTVGQTEFELRHQPVGGSWTTVTGTTAREYLLTGQIGLVEVQVRTRSLPLFGFGPWSAIHTMDYNYAPAADITEPLTGSVSNTARITGAGTYADPDGSAMARAEWTLSESDGGGGWTQLEQIGGTALEVSFDTPAVNDGSYRLTLRAKDGSGLWSATETSDWTVTFLPPPTPQPSTSWDTERGVAMVSVPYVEPAVGVEDSTALIEVWSGDRMLYQYPAPETTGETLVVPDPLAVTHEASTYRVIAWSGYGAVASADVVLETEESVRRAVWLNAGAGWGEVVRVSVFTRTEGHALASVVEHYSDPLPVETFGVAETHAVELTARVCGYAAARAVLDLRLQRTGVYYRDPHGMRMMAAMASPRISSAQADGMFSVGIELTEVRELEDTGVVL